MFAREMLQREVEREALAPWAPALRDLAVSPVKSDQSVRRLLAIAREMSQRAKELRTLAQDFAGAGSGD